MFTLKGRICTNIFIDDEGNEYPLYFRWRPIEYEVFILGAFKDGKMLIFRIVKAL